jgi:hypothetical protein
MHRTDACRAAVPRPLPQRSVVPGVSAPLDDPYVQRIARDLHLSIEEAARRSGLQSILTEMAERVTSALGPRALSTELDFECACVITTLAGSSDVALVESLGGRARVIDPALVAKLQAAEAALGQLSLDEISAWAVDWNIPGLDVYVQNAEAPEVRLLVRTIRTFGIEVKVTSGITIVAR